jgi:hypothetical protein
VISARIASAVTATIDIIENVLTSLGTNELRLREVRVSRPMTIADVKFN